MKKGKDGSRKNHRRGKAYRHVWKVQLSRRDAMKLYGISHKEANRLYDGLQ